MAASLQEETGAIGWYEQRLSLERDAPAGAIMEAAQEEAARDQVFVEMSTAGPDVVNEVRQSVERAGAKFVECPVLGSIPAIETGKAVLFAAGDDAAIKQALPVLEELGEVRRIKDPEAAAKLKLIVNTALTSTSALAAELLVAGKAAGVDPEDVFWVLTRMVPNLANRRSGYVDHRYEPATLVYEPETASRKTT